MIRSLCATLGLLLLVQLIVFGYAIGDQIACLERDTRTTNTLTNIQKILTRER